MTRKSAATQGVSATDLAAILIILGGIAFGLWVVVNGPLGPVPAHIGLNGEVDRWHTRTEAGFMIAVMTLALSGLYLLLRWGRGRALKTDDTGKLRSYGIGQVVLLIATAGVVGIVGALTYGRFEEPGDTALLLRLLGVFLSILMVAAGALIGKSSPNPWVGVRVPWTFQSRLAWDKANRLLGRLWLWSGLLALPVVLIGPQPQSTIGAGVVMVLGALISVIESWRVWRTDPDRRPA